MNSRILLTNVFKSVFLSGVIVILGMTLHSCKDDATESKPGSLAFHIHSLADAMEVENYGDTLLLKSGRPISVTMSQLYISNIRLIKKDGGVIDGPSTNVLVQQGVEEYEIGDVPSGDYKSVMFDVGLSDATNASNPASSDLALFQPSMWFGVTAQPDGFVFINFQGSVDTTNAGTGKDLFPFIYKIGTNAHRVTITMPDKDYSVIPDQLAVVHLEANYGQLLDGVKLNDSGNLNIRTAEENNWPWADVIVANIASMFDYEE